MQEFRSVKVEQTHPLRQKVLRPHQGLGEMVYPNDDHPDCYHLGAVQEDQVIGIGSLYHEDRQGKFGLGEWRIRGMAVDPAVKGSGLGGKILLRLIEYGESKSGKLIWCNARTTACGFYERYGFEKEGPEFDIPGIGPHYVMVKRF